MYGLPDSLRPLSGAEEQVMLALWACGKSAGRREIGLRLAGLGWADSTLLNFLYRLEDKGWVKSGKEANRNLYTPTVTKRAYCVYCMRERLEHLFDGDLTSAVRALASESRCSRTQLEQAARLLEEYSAQADEFDGYDF